MAKGESDFADLSQFFGNELAICVLVVYDELTTVRSYREDIPLYQKLGPTFAEWFDLVIKDEVCHYGNFLKVIRNNHSDRRTEALAIVDALLHRELNGHLYKKTFVLDRRANTFESSKFALESADMVRKAIIGVTR
jgi:hypothetical protein